MATMALISIIACGDKFLFGGVKAVMHGQSNVMSLATPPEMIPALAADASSIQCNGVGAAQAINYWRAESW